MQLKRVHPLLAMVACLCLLLAACADEPDAAEEDAADAPTDDPADDQAGDAPDAEEPEAEEAEEADADGAPEGDAPIPITIASLAGPSLISAIPPILVNEGFAEDHGLDMEVSAFGDIGAYQASILTGEVDAGISGPNAAQGHVLQGGELQVIATYVGLEPMAVITGNPEVGSIEDLPGRSLAATVGSQEFLVLAIYAATLGIDIEADVDLVNGTPPDVISQLAADRVDAGLLWEPSLTPTLRDNDYEVIMEGPEAWAEVTDGGQGWELLWTMQTPFIDEHPEAPEALIAAVQDAVDWLFANPEAAAEHMEDATGLPADDFVDVVDSGRLGYLVEPAWEPEIRDSILLQLEKAVEYGIADDLPPEEELIYSP